VIRSYVALAACAALFTACATKDDLIRAQNEANNYRNERDAIAAHLDELRAENARLANEVRDLGKQVKDADWVKSQREKLAGLLAEFENDTRGIEGVTVRSGREGVVVEVQGEVLFDSGKAEITPGGKDTLQRLIPAVTRGNKRLRIAGHTDDDPIRNSSWGTNLRLSAERALAVAQFLISEGLPAERIAIAGYGEHAPRVPNDSVGNKAQNRRVEILLLDEE